MNHFNSLLHFKTFWMITRDSSANSVDRLFDALGKLRIPLKFSLCSLQSCWCVHGCCLLIAVFLKSGLRPLVTIMLVYVSVVLKWCDSVLVACEGIFLLVQIVGLCNFRSALESLHKHSTTSPLSKALFELLVLSSMIVLFFICNCCLCPSLLFPLCLLFCLMCYIWWSLYC